MKLTPTSTSLETLNWTLATTEVLGRTVTCDAISMASLRASLNRSSALFCFAFAAGFVQQAEGFQLHEVLFQFFLIVTAELSVEALSQTFLAFVADGENNEIESNIQLRC
jgi:hypothetical protein